MNKTYLPSKPNIINSYVSSEKIKITIRVNNIDKNVKINLLIVKMTLSQKYQKNFIVYLTFLIYNQFILTLLL